MRVRRDIMLATVIAIALGGAAALHVGARGSAASLADVPSADAGVATDTVTPAATDTPTPSPTTSGTPTLTPTATPTLVPTPTGTVTTGSAPIVMMNWSLCIAFGASGGTPEEKVAAVLGCGYPSPNSSILALSDALGDHDGIAEPDDFSVVDAATAGQVHQLDTWAVTGPSSGHNAYTDILAFVPSPGPVLFTTTAGTFVESGTSTWLCSPSSIPTHEDCGAPGTPIGLVTAHLTCGATTCPIRGPQTITVYQGGVASTRSFVVIGEPVRMTLDAAPSVLETGGAHQFSGSPPVCNPYPIDGDAAHVRLTAHAVDADGNAVSGAWFELTTDAPDTVAGTSGPTIEQFDGFGAAVFACALSSAPSGQVHLTVHLARAVHVPSLLTVDPNAAPDVADPANLPSETVAVDIVPPPTATPTETLAPTSTDTATPTETATPAPTGTATATPTDMATATDTPTPTPTDTSTATPTDTASPVPTATATDTSTAVPTATTTPAPQTCAPRGQRIALAIGILRDFAAHRGDRRYHARYDVNGDGVIDERDLTALFETPPCHGRTASQE